MVLTDFVLTKIPLVGTCNCPECSGIIQSVLENFHKLYPKYNYIYYGYKNYVYKLSANGNFEIIKKL